MVAIGIANYAFLQLALLLSKAINLFLKLLFNYSMHSGWRSDKKTHYALAQENYVQQV